MGEAKQEEPKAGAIDPADKEEDKKEGAPPPAAPCPIVLFVDLHCVGCAKKIERSILKCRGVESVETDMAKNQVIVKGAVDPRALCERIRKRTTRDPKLLSPLPPADPDPAKTDPPLPLPNDAAVTTVELLVNMHCEACAEQLQKKILKMRGVQTAETHLSSGKVTVTGTVSADKLVEYVYRRTRKLAKVMPRPPKPEEEGEQKPAENPPAEEGQKEESKEEPKKEGDAADKTKEEEKPAQPQENAGDGAKEEKKTPEGGEEQKKLEGEGDPSPAAAVALQSAVAGDEDMAKRMMMYWPPVYVIERVPPPQLFSDENPNACCIS